MRIPIITLLTDFGLKDPYVGSMKGVILGINRRCRLVDLTHEISPHDVQEGAFVLAQAYGTFPKGTIHLSVIDPGVGGPRKPLLFVTQNYYFVGPDNGLFTVAMRGEKIRKVIHLSNQKFFLAHVSSTFHGRDIFAPVAAHLSVGVKPESFGPTIQSWHVLPFPEPFFKEGQLIGEIVHIDTFGNLISNIDRDRLFELTRKGSFAIQIGKRTIRGLKRGYWEGRGREPIALIGSGGFLEISIREGNAQEVLNIKRGSRVVVRKS